jgi:T-complex protein 1 subunit eta
MLTNQMISKDCFGGGTDGRKFRELLEKCASTAMSSKLIRSSEAFFVKMVVDAVLTLDQNDLDEKLIGVKKIPGGAMEVVP